MRMMYLCYFGVKEPLVQTQVLTYLRQLAARGVAVHLLTFEPQNLNQWSRAEREQVRASLAAEGITWFWLRYHRRPSLLATFYDVVAGALKTASLARRHEIKVLHARSHVAMAMALTAQRLIKTQVLFDLRGLLAEEYADAGIWARGSLPFRMVESFERTGLRKADAIVVLTRRMRDALVKSGLLRGQVVEVIPCCVDFSNFHEIPATREMPRFEMVYAGSVTGLYMLEEMAHFFLELKNKQPDAFFRVLTVSPAQAAASVLKKAGLTDSDFYVGAADPKEVPGYLSRARIGISFRKPTISQIAASPTKISEYLAAGLPVVSNAGTGDIDELFETERVGVTLNSFDRDSYQRAVERILELAAAENIRARCRDTSVRNFDLVNVGGTRYYQVYKKLQQAAD